MKALVILATAVLAYPVFLLSPGLTSGGRQVQPKLEESEWRIQQGQAFVTAYREAGVVNGADAEMLIQVGANKAHLGVTVSVTGQSIFYLFEGPTVSNAGTDLSEFNANRTSALTALTDVTHTPTISADGTQIAVWEIHGGTTRGAVGGGIPTHSGAAPELVLAPNTDYLLRLTNDSGGNEDISMTVVFYEPDL